MSARFDGSSSNLHVDFTAGGAAAAGTGAFTIVALVYQTPAAIGGFTNRFAVGLYASTTLTREIINVDGLLFGVSDFSNGFGTLAMDTWYVAAITKPAGAAHYRCHLWPYNAAGTGTMSHGESVNAANHSDGSAITTIQVGKGDVVTMADIAVVGVWTSVLSDAQLDTLKAGNLAAWAALAPKSLISFKNWTGTTGAADVVGTSTQSGVTGGSAISVGAEPSGFDYTLSGGSTPATMSGNVPVLTGSAVVTQSNPATLSGKTPVLTGALSASQISTATLNGSTPLATGSLAASQANTATLVGSVPVITGEIPATEADPGTLLGSTPVLTGSLSAVQVNPALMAGSMPLLTGALSSEQKTQVTLSGALPLLTGQLAVTQINLAALNGRLPLLTGRINQAPPSGRVDISVLTGQTRFATLTADGTRVLYPLTAGETRADTVHAQDTRPGHVLAADTRIQRGP